MVFPTATTTPQLVKHLAMSLIDRVLSAKA
jgi:hypothetical protein